jgi:hypothetical protein
MQHHTSHGTLLFSGNDRSSSRPRGRELTKDESEGILYAFETLDAERTGFVSRKQLKVRTDVNVLAAWCALPAQALWSCRSR